MFAQALYPLLVVNSDDFGRQSGDAYTVKYAVWPTAPRDEATFESALHALERVGLIRRYYAAGETVLQIVEFDAHQTGLHRRTKSRFPEAPEVAEDSGKFWEPPADSGNVREIPSEEKRTELNGRERKRAAKETHEERTAQELRSASDGDTLPRERYERFLAAYPIREDTLAAWEAWCALGPPDETFADQIIAGAEQYAASHRVRHALDRGETQFIKSPPNWLKAGAWMDQQATSVRAGPKSCRHQPRCVDAVACTARATAERDRPPLSASA
jgi:hypothetical protein